MFIGGSGGPTFNFQLPTLNVERFLSAIHEEGVMAGTQNLYKPIQAGWLPKNCGSVRGNPTILLCLSAEQRRQSVGNKHVLQKESISGKTDKSPRNEFWYVNDDGRSWPRAGRLGKWCFWKIAGKLLASA